MRKGSSWDNKFCIFTCPYESDQDREMLIKECNKIAYKKELKIEFCDNLNAKILNVEVL